MNTSIHQMYAHLTNTIYNVLGINSNDIKLNYYPESTHDIHLSISNRIYPGSEIYVTSSVRYGDSIELLLYYPSVDSAPQVHGVIVFPANGKVISVDDSDELYNTANKTAAKNVVSHTQTITLLDFNNNSPSKIAEDLYNKLCNAFPIIIINIIDTTINTINVYIKYRTTDSHGDVIYTTTQPIELSNKETLYFNSECGDGGDCTYNLYY